MGRILRILILSGCSYRLSPLGGGQELHILSHLPLAEIPGSGVGVGQVGAAVLSPASSLDFLALLLPSRLLWCWLDEVIPALAFTSVGAFPLAMRTLGIFGVPANECPLPSSFPLGGCPWFPILVFWRGRKVFSYSVPPPLRGVPASLPSIVWLCVSPRVLFCCVWMPSVVV